MEPSIYVACSGSNTPKTSYSNRSPSQHCEEGGDHTPATPRSPPQLSRHRERKRRKTRTPPPTSPSNERRRDKKKRHELPHPLPHRPPSILPLLPVTQAWHSILPPTAYSMCATDEAVNLYPLSALLLLLPSLTYRPPPATSCYVHVPPVAFPARCVCASETAGRA